MSQTFYSIHDRYISHHGVKGQKWGIRRYQNPDGSLTAEGLARLHRATDRSRMAKSKKLENTGYKTAAVGMLGTLGGSVAGLAGVNPILAGVGLGAGLLTMSVGSVMETVAAMREKRNWNFVKKVATNYSKANPKVPKSLVTTLAYAGYDEMLKRPASDVVAWSPNEDGSLDVAYKPHDKK